MSEFFGVTVSTEVVDFDRVFPAHFTFLFPDAVSLIKVTIPIPLGFGVATLTIDIQNQVVFVGAADLTGRHILFSFMVSKKA